MADFNEISLSTYLWASPTPGTVQHPAGNGAAQAGAVVPQIGQWMSLTSQQHEMSFFVRNAGATVEEDNYRITINCPVGSQSWSTGTGGPFPVQNGTFRVLHNMAPNGAIAPGATFVADIPGMFTSETRAEGLLKYTVATFTGVGLTTQACADPNITWSGQREAALPVCAIEMSQASYVNGDTVTAQVARLANPDTGPVSVEVGLWIEGPGFSPIPFTKVGADGSMRLSPGFNQNFGPIVVGQVTPSLPRGTYAFNCRIVDPVTLRLLAEDLNPFDIR